jgi:hypothetical protein
MVIITVENQAKQQVKDHLFINLFANNMQYYIRDF